jgi:hypothetical protein
MSALSQVMARFCYTVGRIRWVSPLPVNGQANDQ